MKQHHTNNPDRRKAASAKWNKANATKIRNAKNAWRKSNLEKTRKENAKASAKYAKLNKTKRVALVVKRTADKLQRTPKYADLKAIELFYRNCPKDHEVDHIIPLRGKNVSGLHVLNNLQYLTKIENRLKGNKYV